MDRIAKMGLRYTQFNSTSCSLAAALTPAATITRRLQSSPNRPPATGYNAIIGVDNATIGEILKDNGDMPHRGSARTTTHLPQYSTARLGQWLTGMGFEASRLRAARRISGTVSFRTPRGPLNQPPGNIPSWRTTPQR
jgi:arylsulfatase